MTRRVALVVGAFSALLVVLIGVPAILLYRDAEIARLRLGIQRDALVLAGDIAALPRETAAARLEEYAAETGARIVVVDGDLRLQLDTQNPVVGADADAPATFDRPELRSALTGAVATGVRDSDTLQQLLSYAAVPVRQGTTITGALRITMPANTVDAKVEPLQWALFWLLLLVVGLALAISWVIAKALGRPLEQLAEEAHAIGDNASHRIGEVKGPPEVQAVAEALDDTANRLATAIERSRAVAEEASHHLRTPLGALRLRVEALSDMSAGQAHEEAESALVEIDRLNRRIEQILTMSRGEGTDSWVAIDVAAAALAREPLYVKNAHTAGVALTMTVDPDCGHILGMPGTVERTLDELTANAFTYAESAVDISIGSDDRSIWLKVEDDGPGIPTTEHDTVFNRFVRGSGAAAGGTGLGLAMLRDSARSIGGDAYVEEQDTGTTIVVEWPKHILNKT